MKPERVRESDRSRRVTPDLITFYIKRAHELRAEYYRDMWRAIWALAEQLSAGVDCSEPSLRAKR